MASTFSIVLSAPTLLYAPIYLAKCCELSDVFRYLTLDYAPPDRNLGGGIDPLFQVALKKGNQTVLMAVGDPMRIADFQPFLKGETEHGYNSPIILGGLITRPYYCLCSETNFGGQVEKAVKDISTFFTPDRRMTGYSLACFALHKNGGSRLASAVLDSATLEDRLFDEGLPPGRPEDWHQYFGRRERLGRNYAYMTTNVASEDENAFLAFHDVLKSEFFMTGFVSDQETKDEHGYALDEALEGIRRAVDRIYNDPCWCAQQLALYAHQKTPFLVHHLGKEGQARTWAKRAIDAFERAGGTDAFDGILISATGCSAYLKDLEHVFSGDPVWASRAKVFATKVRDFLELATPQAPAASYPVRVAWQAPCSLQNGLKLADAGKALLQSAGFEVLDIPESHFCCGSAGSYSILQPEIASRLRERKLSNIVTVRPDVVATANIGCLHHLSGPDAPLVVHLAELIDWAEGGATPEFLADEKASR